MTISLFLKKGFIRYLLLMVISIIHLGRGYAQSRFSLSATLSPKMSINNNTSVTVSNRLFISNSESDARSALGYSYDYSIGLSYTFNKHRISAGIGRFDVRQMFRPSFILFGGGFKNIQKSYYFLQIPVDYERQIYTQKKWQVWAGAGITIATDVYSDIIKPSGTSEGYVEKTDGSLDKNMKYYYSTNLLNMETFNLLINASAKVAYQLNNHFAVSGGVGMRQGFRPLMTSVVHFERKNPSQTTTISHVTSINNGQCILINFGVQYVF